MAWSEDSDWSSVACSPRKSKVSFETVGVSQVESALQVSKWLECERTKKIEKSALYACYGSLIEAVYS